jgi:hypothetical protein
LGYVLQFYLFYKLLIRGRRDIATNLAGALPLGIAMYPQKLALDPKSLEEKFHNLKNPKTGEPITVVFSNKGL